MEVQLRHTRAMGYALHAACALPSGRLVLKERPLLATQSESDRRRACAACFAPAAAAEACERCRGYVLCGETACAERFRRCHGERECAVLAEGEWRRWRGTREGGAHTHARTHTHTYTHTRHAQGGWRHNPLATGRLGVPLSASTHARTHLAPAEDVEGRDASCREIVRQAAQLLDADGAVSSINEALCASRPDDAADETVADIDAALDVLQVQRAGRTSRFRRSAWCPTYQSLTDRACALSPNLPSPGEAARRRSRSPP